MLFDEIFNYHGYDGPSGELRALYEWTTENPEIKWKWLGMTGEVKLITSAADTNYKLEKASLQVI